MSGRRGRSGGSLVEVLVALVVLQVTLLGVTGLLLLTSGHLARAMLLERGLAVAGSVADSLAMEAVAEAGETVRDGWRVTWAAAAGGGQVVRARLVDSEAPGPTVELRVP